MEKANIRPGDFYAVKRADRLIVPALVLSNRLWDRLPEGADFVYRPADRNERWATTLDRQTGARRGIPAVFPRPGKNVPRSVLIPALARLSARAGELGLLGDDAGEAAVAALRESIEEPLLIDVVSDSKIITPWTNHVTGENLHSCPEEDCGADVTMNAASRMRAHRMRNGAPCPRSNTALTKEERNAP
ncbi:hypothetical protein QFZ75_008048 [Streptomyces sp. V3I8]|uniref:hypothetical protein n=1 Tax=Streptomyces sp. V3I8 TaxID=3042279 RepID=UPI002780187F|nr:hypothetical protein [Streptomyces sp. V3I8]MDQ1041546.1 hypothetical protein [Streptomyces sp. V3I8]